MRFHLGRAGLERLDVAENQLVGLLLVGQRVRNPVVDAAFVVEEDGELAKLLFAVAATQVVDVVPAVCMELIPHQRHAEKELHLRIGHALFELEHHFARHKIPLVNVVAIGLQKIRNVIRRVVPDVGHGVAAAQQKDGGDA